MEAKTKVLAVLKRHHCPQIRSNGHPVYRLPDGSAFPLPKSPSDHRSWDNSLAELRIALGISKQGRIARPGTTRTKKPRKQKSQPLDEGDTLTTGFAFSETLRAALKGERPQKPEPPVKKIIKERAGDPGRPVHIGVSRKRPLQVFDRGDRRPGPVRQWTQEDVAAANRAAQCGMLNEFMQHHDEANRPVVHSTKEVTHMGLMEVSHIDASITELRMGQEAAEREASEQQSLLVNLEDQKVSAESKRMAALDKRNSIQETIASLELAREAMVKVRPMLGLLISTPKGAVEITTYSKKQRPTLQSVVKILEKESRPMTSDELFQALLLVPGFQDYTRGALYQVLYQQKKKNGDALVRLVENGRYQAVSPREASA